MSIISPYQKNILDILADPTANKRIKTGIINSCDTKTINKICEIVLNVINKNIKLSEEQLNNLKPFAKYCRKLLNKKLNIREKKKILIKKGIQRGGFLQFIIPAVVSGIATIISSLISKKSE
jgi:hypothetical protein